MKYMCIWHSINNAILKIHVHIFKVYNSIQGILLQNSIESMEMFSKLDRQKISVLFNECSHKVIVNASLFIDILNIIIQVRDIYLRFINWDCRVQ